MATVNLQLQRNKDIFVRARATKSLIKEYAQRVTLREHLFALVISSEHSKLRRKTRSAKMIREFGSETHSRLLGCLHETEDVVFPRSNVTGAPFPECVTRAPRVCIS
jgi:hypothetical protein